MDSKWHYQASARSSSSSSSSENLNENKIENTLDLTLSLGLPTKQPQHVNLPVPISLPLGNLNYAEFDTQPQGVSNNNGEGPVMVNYQAQVHGGSLGMNNYGTILKGGNNNYGAIQYGFMANNHNNNNGGADNFHGELNFTTNQVTRLIEGIGKHPFYLNLLGSQYNIRDSHHNNNFNTGPPPFGIPPITARTISNYTLLDSCPRRVHRKNENSSFFGSGYIGEQQCEGGIYNNPNKRCTNYNCNTNDTPMWRRGPLGPKSLCNACGIKYRKEEEKKRARAAAVAVAEAEAEANNSNGDDQKV